MSMRCSRATKAILDGQVGPADAAREAALSLHLREYAACRRESLEAERMAVDLAGLRCDYPFEIDVRPRVLARLADLQRPSTTDVPTRQLGWAALAAGIAAVMLVGGFIELLPDLARLARGLLVAAGSLGDLIGRLLQPLSLVMTVPLRLAWGLFKWAAPLLDGLQPLAIGAAAACTAAMVATIAVVLSRDLRRTHPLMTREEL
jgi:hypothetical protein